MKTKITLIEHLRRIRELVKPENKARDPEKMRAAALRRWEIYRASKNRKSQ